MSASLVLMSVVGIGLASAWADHAGPRGASTHQSARFTPRLVNVNIASPDELRLLPHIGPKLAEAIVEDRRRNGPYASLEDLERVHGIGPRTVSGLHRLATTTNP